jgi:hypothetical protein
MTTEREKKKKRSRYYKLEFVHSCIAGHGGAFQTRAHVGRRAYWNQRRKNSRIIDVDKLKRKEDVRLMEAEMSEQ